MKKYLCMLLAFALVLGLAGCGNGDPETSELPDASVENSDGPAYEDGATPSDLLPATPEPTPTPDPEPIETLKVCGISIVKNGQLTNLAYKGVKYENGVLLLDSAELESGPSANALIEYTGGDLEINVSGECKFSATEAEGIKGSGDLSLTGDGSLSIVAADVAGISVEGTLTVGCALNVTGAPAAESSETLAAEGFAISVNDETTLTVAAAA